MDLHPKKLLDALPDLRIDRSSRLTLRPDAGIDLFGGTEQAVLNVSHDVKSELLQVLSKYGSLKDSQLKTAVYMTGPMRQILRQERGMP